MRKFILSATPLFAVLALASCTSEPANEEPTDWKQEQTQSQEAPETPEETAPAPGEKDVTLHSCKGVQEEWMEDFTLAADVSVENPSNAGWTYAYVVEFTDADGTRIATGYGMASDVSPGMKVSGPTPYEGDEDVATYVEKDPGEVECRVREAERLEY